MEERRKRVRKTDLRLGGGTAFRSTAPGSPPADGGALTPAEFEILWHAQTPAVESDEEECPPPSAEDGPGE